VRMLCESVAGVLGSGRERNVQMPVMMLSTCMAMAARKEQVQVDRGERGRRESR